MKVWILKSQERNRDRDGAREPVTQHRQSDLHEGGKELPEETDKDNDTDRQTREQGEGPARKTDSELRSISRFLESECFQLPVV